MALFQGMSRFRSINKWTIKRRGVLCAGLIGAICAIAGWPLSSFAQNQLSVQDQLQAIMDRFPGGGMKVQPAVIRYEDSADLRRASEAGEPCLECMGVRRIEVKQITGSPAPFVVSSSKGDRQTNALGIVACSHDGHRYTVTQATVVESSNRVMVSGHFDFDVNESFDWKKECWFSLVKNQHPYGKRYQFTNIVGKEKSKRMIDRDSEWAILTLEETVPREISPLKVKRTGVSELINQIPVYVFAQDNIGSANTYVFQKKGSRCHLEVANNMRAGFALAHTCNTVPGWSGAPIIWIDPSGELYVVGIHNGSRTVNQNWGIRMDGDLYRAAKGLPLK